MPSMGRRTASASFWWVRTRRSWAICTTCSGDTHAVHVSLDANDAVVLDAVIKGDTVREVLDYVEFDTATLMAKLAVGRRNARSAAGGSTSKSPAGCSGSTRTVSTATPTSRNIGDAPLE